METQREILWERKNKSPKSESDRVPLSQAGPVVQEKKEEHTNEEVKKNREPDS